MLVVYVDLMCVFYCYIMLVVIVVNFDCEFIVMNVVVEWMFGYLEFDIFGKKSEIFYVDLCDYGCFGLFYYGFQVEGFDMLKFYFVCYWICNGCIFDGEIVGCLVEDENGKCIGLFCIIIDVINCLVMQVKLEVSDIQFCVVLVFVNEGVFFFNLVIGLGLICGFINEFLGIVLADVIISLDCWIQVI